jgi:transposase InsO family protein
VNRQFTAPRPNALWVSDFTYVATWSGTVYVAFVLDAHSRRILGWRVTTSKSTPLVLSVLEQALFTRRRTSTAFTTTGLLHHSDAGSQGGLNRSSQHLS